MNDLKTATQWQREGRKIKKGSHAEMYRVNDDRTQARALFSTSQTEPWGEPEEADSWTVDVTAAEWQQIKAEQREARGRPKVKVRRLAEGGTEVWCGPDSEIIALLRHFGYRYHAATRYWRHPNKDPDTVADAFEHGKIRGQNVRVNRDWARVDGIEL